MSDLVERARERARIRREIPGRKAAETGEPDRIADLLDELAARIEALEAKLDALVKAAEPFAIAAEQVRVGYASRYSDKDLGFANFDKMPDHWPVERCVFTMGDFRALSHALKQAKDAP